MPELAPIQTQPPHGSCPTAEDLACYIDGELSPEEAAQVTKHLASCESCFEVYSEALQFQLESEPAPLGKVVPFPAEKRRPPVVWWSSIAALLVVGLGFGVYSYLFAPPPALMAAHLAAPFQGRSGLAQSLWKGELKRGSSDGEDEDTLPYRVAAFRTGVQVVNLQVSLQANDRDNLAGYVFPCINATLRGQYGVDDLVNGYEGIRSAIDKGETPYRLLPKATQLATESRELLDPLYFDLGQCVEAGHLAAISRDPTFFRLPETRSFLRRVLWRDRLGFKDSKLPTGSRGDLEAIYQITDQSTLRSSDFKALQDHFRKILDANYPQ